jgi:hypothetical protein
MTRAQYYDYYWGDFVRIKKWEESFLNNLTTQFVTQILLAHMAWEKSLPEYILCTGTVKPTLLRIVLGNE